MSGKQFDPIIVRKFIENISVYTIGQGVALNTGERGYIININRTNPTRPLVRVVYNINSKKLTNPYNLNLADRTDVIISETIETDDV